MVKAFFALLSTLLLMFGNTIGLVGTDGTGHEDFRNYKNVILIIGDGNGYNTINASEKLQKMTVSMRKMPVKCESKTRSFSSSVTDSAAGGTALATGIRTYNSAIGVYAFAPLSEHINVPTNLCELAIDMGKSAGVVTTDKTSGATPSAFSAHSAFRIIEPDLSIDQMSSELSLIWGGKSETITKAGCKLFGKTLITTKTEMENLEPDSKSIGQFDMGKMAAVSTNEDTPLLSDMAKKAIEILNADEDGFFLMIEAAHIDKFSHNNDLIGASIHERLLSETVDVALDFAEKDGDTLVVVTADHETGGITLDEKTGEYYYTKEAHTGVNVPCFVSAEDAGFVSGEAYDNCNISTQLARVMGAQKHQFPSVKDMHTFYGIHFD